MNIRTLSTDEEIFSFLDEFCEYTENRVYILTAIARPKENPEITSNTIPIFRQIVTNPEQLRRKYALLSSVTENYTPREDITGELTFRFYISINSRDVRSSFHRYQKQLLDYNHQIANGHTETKKKIQRLDKEWKSTLQSDTNKEDSYFIIDIDEKTEELLTQVKTAIQNEDQAEILSSIETPNGYHIITTPFNHPNCDGIQHDEIEIKTDGMLFLKIQ